MSRQSELAALGRVSDTGALSNRNLIINGAMKVAQRGTSSTGITTAGYYTIDRLKFGEVTGTWTMSQSSDAPDGFSKSAKLECTTANASPTSNQEVRLGYLIEGQDLQHLNYGSSTAKTITLSFWVKSNKTGTGALWIYTDDGGNSTSPNYTINAANTWEYKSVVIDGNTAQAIADDNTSGLRVNWYLAAGSDYIGSTANSWVTSAEPRMTSSDINFADTVGNNFYLTGVQLEVGDTATEFEHRSYGDELARCQRYYSFLGGNAYAGISTGMKFSGNGSVHGIQYPVTMRAAPSVGISNLIVTDRTIYDLDVTGLSATIAGLNSVYIRTGWVTPWGSNGDAVLLAVKNGTTGRITFDAEL